MYWQKADFLATPLKKNSSTNDYLGKHTIFSECHVDFDEN